MYLPLIPSLYFLVYTCKTYVLSIDTSYFWFKYNTGTGVSVNYSIPEAYYLL